MCRLYSAVLEMFASFDMSFRSVLSLEHELDTAWPTVRQLLFNVIGNPKVSSAVNKHVYFLHSGNCQLLVILKSFAPAIILLLSVSSLPNNLMFVHGNYIRLYFYNIHQCQLPISWVTMVTDGPDCFLDGIVITASPCKQGFITVHGPKATSPLTLIILST